MIHKYIFLLGFFLSMNFGVSLLFAEESNFVEDLYISTYNDIKIKTQESAIENFNKYNKSSFSTSASQVSCYWGTDDTGVRSLKIGVATGEKQVAMSGTLNELAACQKLWETEKAQQMFFAQLQESIEKETDMREIFVDGDLSNSPFDIVSDLNIIDIIYFGSKSNILSYPGPFYTIFTDSQQEDISPSYRGNGVDNLSYSQDGSLATGVVYVPLEGTGDRATIISNNNSTLEGGNIANENTDIDTSENKGEEIILSDEQLSEVIEQCIDPDMLVFIEEEDEENLSEDSDNTDTHEWSESVKIALSDEEISYAEGVALFKEQVLSSDFSGGYPDISDYVAPDPKDLCESDETPLFGGFPFYGGVVCIPRSCIESSNSHEGGEGALTWELRKCTSIRVISGYRPTSTTYENKLEKMAEQLKLTGYTISRDSDEACIECLIDKALSGLAMLESAQGRLTPTRYTSEQWMLSSNNSISSGMSLEPLIRLVGKPVPFLTPHTSSGEETDISDGSEDESATDVNIDTSSSNDSIFREAETEVIGEYIQNNQILKKVLAASCVDNISGINLDQISQSDFTDFCNQEEISEQSRVLAGHKVVGDVSLDHLVTHLENRKKFLTVFYDQYFTDLLQTMTRINNNLNLLDEISLNALSIQQCKK